LQRGGQETKIGLPNVKLIVGNKKALSSFSFEM
jgi:hypothetical protein